MIISKNGFAPIKSATSWRVNSMEDHNYYYGEDHEALPGQVCPECGEQLYIERVFHGSWEGEAEQVTIYCLKCGYKD